MSEAAEEIKEEIEREKKPVAKRVESLRLQIETLTARLPMDEEDFERYKREVTERAERAGVPGPEVNVHVVDAEFLRLEAALSKTKKGIQSAERFLDLEKGPLRYAEAAIAGLAAFSEKETPLGPAVLTYTLSRWGKGVTLQAVIPHRWAVHLIHRGRALGGALDGLLDEAVRSPFGVERREVDPAEWERMRGALTGLLERIHQLGEEVGTYQSDVRHYVQYATALQNEASVTAVAEVRDDLLGAYQRAHDVTLMKLNGVAAGEVSASNHRLSVKAIALARASIAIALLGIAIGIAIALLGIWVEVRNGGERGERDAAPAAVDHLTAPPEHPTPQGALEPAPVPTEPVLPQVDSASGAGEGVQPTPAEELSTE